MDSPPHNYFADLSSSDEGGSGADAEMVVESAPAAVSSAGVEMVAERSAPAPVSSSDEGGSADGRMQVVETAAEPVNSVPPGSGEKRQREEDGEEVPCYRGRVRIRRKSNDGLGQFGRAAPTPAEVEKVAQQVLEKAAAAILAREEEDKLTALLSNLNDLANGNPSEMFKFLNKPITMEGVDRETLLHLAAKANYPHYFSAPVPEGQAPPTVRDYVSRLLEYRQSMSVKNPVWLTPLHHAAFGNDVAAMKQLIEKQAPVDATTIGGYSPLIYALQAAYPITKETVTTLLAAGADPLFQRCPAGHCSIPWCIGSEADTKDGYTLKGQPEALDTILRWAYEKRHSQPNEQKQLEAERPGGIVSPDFHSTTALAWCLLNLSEATQDEMALLIAPLVQFGAEPWRYEGILGASPMDYALNMKPKPWSVCVAAMEKFGSKERSRVPRVAYKDPSPPPAEKAKKEKEGGSSNGNKDLKLKAEQETPKKTAYKVVKKEKEPKKRTSEGGKGKEKLVIVPPAEEEEPTVDSNALYENINGAFGTDIGRIRSGNGGGGSSSTGRVNIVGETESDADVIDLSDDVECYGVKNPDPYVELSTENERLKRENLALFDLISKQEVITKKLLGDWTMRDPNRWTKAADESLDLSEQVCRKKNTMQVLSAGLRRENIQKKVQDAWDAGMSKVKGAIYARISDNNQKKRYLKTLEAAVPELCIVAISGNPSVHTTSDTLKALREQLTVYFSKDEEVLKECWEGMDERIKIKLITDDARPGLKGTYGGYATKALAQNTIIGPYVGEVSMETEIYSKDQALPELLFKELYNYPITPPPPIKTINLDLFKIEHLEQDSDTKLLGSYFSSGLVRKFIYDLPKELNGQPDGRLVMDPFPYHGNQMMFINDFRKNPLSPFCPKNQKSFANVESVLVTHKGWPYLFLATRTPVEKGVEFSLDYGDSYWDITRQYERSHKGVLNCMNAARAHDLQLVEHVEKVKKARFVPGRALPKPPSDKEMLARLKKRREKKAKDEREKKAKDEKEKKEAAKKNSKSKTSGGASAEASAVVEESSGVSVNGDEE